MAKFTFIIVFDLGEREHQALGGVRLVAGKKGLLLSKGQQLAAATPSPGPADQALVALAQEARMQLAHAVEAQAGGRGDLRGG